MKDEARIRDASRCGVDEKRKRESGMNRRNEARNVVLVDDEPQPSDSQCSRRCIPSHNGAAQRRRDDESDAEELRVWLNRKAFCADGDADGTPRYYSEEGTPHDDFCGSGKKLSVKRIQSSGTEKRKMKTDGDAKKQLLSFNDELKDLE